jgi:hypothetical protein
MGVRKAVFCGLIFAFTAGQAAAQSFQFAAIGDTGYSKKSEQEFNRMIAAMNREPLAFVVHVGGFEADPRPYMRKSDDGHRAVHRRELQECAGAIPDLRASVRPDAG